ncbi:MAG: hypothetical protein ABR562_07610 [Thermoplasmatota archaeon]|nr:hypothetical protein [Halobacteriales archaeon]
MGEFPATRRPGPHPTRYLPVSRLVTPRPPSAPHGLWSWVRLHRLATAAIGATLMLAVATVAVLTLQLNTTVSPAAKAPPVVFAAGGDYTTINAAGFATLTLGTSATSATLAMSGVAGAASVSLGNVMKITNSDATQAFSVTLTRSTTLNAAISSLAITVKDGGTTLVTWDPKSAASSSSFTLPAATATDVSLAIVIADGTAVGSLGSFAMQVSMTPA